MSDQFNPDEISDIEASLVPRAPAPRRAPRPPVTSPTPAPKPAEPILHIVPPPARGVHASDLQHREFPAPRYAVEGIIPEGLTLLAGAPKVGKSFMLMHLAEAVAMGGRAFGKIPVEQGGVLYYALEDTERRLQDRMAGIAGDEDWPWSLKFFTELRRVDDGGLDDIRADVAQLGNVRLIMIDTLAMIRPLLKSNEGVYQADYMAVRGLLQLSHDLGVSILVSHHDRKQGAEDALDTLSGTKGLAGGVDGAIILKRPRMERDGTMDLIGRDIEEQRIGVRFDISSEVPWTVLGPVSGQGLTPEQSAILTAIEEADCPLMGSEIAVSTGKRRNTINQALARMRQTGRLVRYSGAYGLPDWQERYGDTPPDPVTVLETQGSPVTPVTPVTPPFSTGSGVSKSPAWTCEHPRCSQTYYVRDSEGHKWCRDHMTYLSL